MKNLFFGLGAAVIALSMSAFTNANRAEGDYLVQASNNSYTLVTEGSYEPSSCNAADSDVCAYVITTSGSLDGTAPYSPQEIQDNINNNKIEAFEGTGLYTP